MKYLFAFLLLVGGVIGACGRTDQKTLPPDGGSHLFGFGPNPSPACLVSDNGGGYVAAAPNGINVTAGDTVTVKLASYAGVRSWQLTVFGLDEISTAPTLTYSVGPPGTYSFTFPNATGRTVLLQSVVNGGTNVNGVKQSSYSTTIGIFTLAGSGQRVLATGETFETCPAGWICDWNASLRAINQGTYGGVFNTSAGVLSMPTLATAYQLTFDTTFSTARNTSTSGNGVKVLSTGPVIVSAEASFHTGSASTTIFLFLFKNGVLLAGPQGISNTYGASAANAESSTAFQTLTNSAVNDVYTLWALASSNTITLNYFASIVVSGLGTLQGVAGPAGPPGSGVGGTPYYVSFAGGGSYSASPFTVPSGGTEVSNDVSAGDCTDSITNGATDVEKKIFVIEKQNSDGTGNVFITSGSANIFDASGVTGNVGVSIKQFSGPAGTKVEMTWRSLSNGGLGGWYTG